MGGRSSSHGRQRRGGQRRENQDGHAGLVQLGDLQALPQVPHLEKRKRENVSRRAQGPSAPAPVAASALPGDRSGTSLRGTRFRTERRTRPARWHTRPASGARPPARGQAVRAGTLGVQRPAAPSAGTGTALSSAFVTRAQRAHPDPGPAGAQGPGADSTPQPTGFQARPEAQEPPSPAPDPPAPPAPARRPGPRPPLSTEDDSPSRCSSPKASRPGSETAPFGHGLPCPPPSRLQGSSRTLPQGTADRHT